MKKLFAFILTTILILSFSATVLAEKAIYDTAGDLYKVWNKDMPDYVCMVYSTDGSMAKLTFVLQDNELGHDGELEIRDLVKDDSTLTFVYREGGYSRNYLYQVIDELTDEYCGKNLGIELIADDQANNRVIVGIHPLRIKDEDILNMMREIKNKYGDVVYFGTAETILKEGSGDEMQPQLIFTMGVLLIVLVGMFFIFQKRNVLLFQTNSGTIVSSQSAPSAKEVEDMVRNKKYNIPSDLDKKVMNEIGKME